MWVWNSCFELAEENLRIGKKMSISGNKHQMGTDFREHTWEAYRTWPPRQVWLTAKIFQTALCRSLCHHYFSPQTGLRQWNSYKHYEKTAAMPCHMVWHIQHLGSVTTVFLFPKLAIKVIASIRSEAAWQKIKLEAMQCSETISMIQTFTVW